MSKNYFTDLLQTIGTYFFPPDGSFLSVGRIQLFFSSQNPVENGFQAIHDAFHFKCNESINFANV